MNFDNYKFYVKSTDNLRIANISSYRFVEDKILSAENVAANQQSNTGEQNTKLYEEMKTKIIELESKVDELQSKLNKVLEFEYIMLCKSIVKSLGVVILVFAYLR